LLPVLRFGFAGARRVSLGAQPPRADLELFACEPQQFQLAVL
jgi:hypothetical protein